MNLVLIGNYGATNVGDDAILSSLLKLFSGHQVTVFSAHPQQTEKQFKVPCAPLFPLGLRSLFKFGFRSSFKVLKHADLVVLGGGGLFQDDKLYACFLWAWQVFWVKRLKKPLFICATGVGPLKTKLGKWLTNWAYRQAKCVTVRDDGSKKVLLNLGFSNERIHVTADPAFLFEAPLPAKKIKKQQLFVSIRSWLGYTPTILQAMTDFLMQLKQEEWEFTFVSMQSIKEEDQSVLRQLIAKVGGKFLIPDDFSALLREMSQADAVVGMRYHFLIAALLSHVPFLAVAYSPKVSELVEGSSLQPYLIQVAELSAKLLESRFRLLLNNPDQIAIQQVSLLEHLKVLAQENERQFQEFIKTIDPVKSE